MLCAAGRALTGVVLLTEPPLPPALVLDETDFGSRRSGPRDADRAGVRLTGWKIGPKFIIKGIGYFNSKGWLQGFDCYSNQTIRVDGVRIVQKKNE